jgi:DNA-binding response OmpR family regulator
MLHAIAKFAGHVKSRQQLMHESNMVVDDTTITSHIKRIRKKFIQVDQHFDCVETVYGMAAVLDLPTYYSPKSVKMKFMLFEGIERSFLH